MGVFLENGPFIIDKEDDLTIQGKVFENNELICN